MSDKKTIRVAVIGEVNTGKTTFGNLLVRAFREMGFLAEYQGEQVLTEDDIEKRLAGLLKIIDKVLIEEVQLPRGITGEELPNVMNWMNVEYGKVVAENRKMKAMLEELDQAIKAGKITAPGFVPSPVLQAQGVPLCPHARPATELCPHCQGLSGGLEIHEPPKLPCPKCGSPVDMLIQGLCQRCHGMVTG